MSEASERRQAFPNTSAPEMPAAAPVVSKTAAATRPRLESVTLYPFGVSSNQAVMTINCAPTKAPPLPRNYPSARGFSGRRRSMLKDIRKRSISGA